MITLPLLNDLTSGVSCTELLYVTIDFSLLSANTCPVKAKVFLLLKFLHILEKSL